MAQRATRSPFSMLLPYNIDTLAGKINISALVTYNIDALVGKINISPLVPYNIDALVGKIDIKGLKFEICLNFQLLRPRSTFILSIHPTECV